MSTFKTHKVISTLPSQLEADSIYAVRVGVGFDLYITDTTGSIAHKVNEITSSGILNKLVEVDGQGSGLDADLLDGYEWTDFALATSNVEILYAQKNLNSSDAKYQFLSSISQQVINLPNAITSINKEFILVNTGNASLEVWDNGVPIGLILNFRGRATCFATGINWEIFVDYQIDSGLNETSTIDGGVF
jgi:hypothetical protein